MSTRIGGRVNLYLILLAAIGILTGVAGVLYGLTRDGESVPVAAEAHEEKVASSAASVHPPSPRIETNNAFADKTLSPTLRNSNNDLSNVGSMTCIPEKPDDSGDATISGAVLDFEGRALSGIKVNAIRSDFESSHFEIERDFDPVTLADRRGAQANDLKRQTRVIVSDSAGRFCFTGLDAKHSYDLWVSEEGVGTGSAKNVAAGDTKDIYITPGLFKVRGQLTNETGKLPSRFMVQALDGGIPDPIAIWMAESFENPDGSFVAVLPRSGSFVLRVVAPGFYQVNDVTIDVFGTSDSVVEIPISEAACLAGTLTSLSNEEPLPGINVMLYDANGGAASVGMSLSELRSGPSRPVQQNARYYATTDSLGRYMIDSIKPGTYRLGVTVGHMTKDETVTLEAGRTNRDIAIDIGADVIVNISTPQNGILPPLNPTVSAQLIGEPDNPAPFLLVMPNRLEAAPGRFRYAGIPPGKYKVSVNADGYAMATQEATLVSGPNTLSFELQGACWLSGVVTMSDGGPLPTSPMLHVGVFDPDDTDYKTYRTAQEKYLTNSQGWFSLGPILPGQKIVRVISGIDGQRRWVRFEASLTLTSGKHTYDIRIDPGCMLSVSIVDETGKIVPGWCQIESTDPSTLDSERYMGYAYCSQGNCIGDIELPRPGRYR